MRSILLALAASSALLIAAPASLARQGTPRAPERKPVRPSVLDLKGEAKKPRPGEVVPDSTLPAVPSPSPSAPPSAPPAPAADPAAPGPAATDPEHPGEEAAPATLPTAAPTPAPGERPEASPRPARTPSTTPASPVAPRRVVSPGAANSRDPSGARSTARFVALAKMKIEILSITGDASQAQWRLAEDQGGKPGAWSGVTAGSTETGRYDFRTGVDVTIKVRIDDGPVLTIGSLGRVRLERRIRSDGADFPGVYIARGEVRIAPENTHEVVVRTPDDSYVLVNGGVTYDAINDTQLSR